MYHIYPADADKGKPNQTKGDLEIGVSNIKYANDTIIYL
jgi:hypothetical protein